MVQSSQQVFIERRTTLYAPCIFIKKSEIGFVIISVYVDDISLVGTPEELTRTTKYLKKEFEIKYLSR